MGGTDTMQLGVSNTIIAIVFEFVDNEDFETFNIKIDTMAEELETPKFLERPCRAYIWQFLLFWHRKGIHIKIKKSSAIKDPNKSNTHKYFRHSNVKRYELALLRSGYFFYFSLL